jgi:hypothetical protein
MKLLPPPGPERWRAIGALAAILMVAAYYVPGMLWPDAPSASATRAPAPNAPGLPGQTGGAASTSNAKNAAAQAKRAALDIPVSVELAALEPSTESSSPESGRNPFRFGEPPPPPKPPYVPPPKLADPPPYVPPPPPTPQVELTLVVTMLVADGDFRANFKDKKTGAQFTGKEGDIIDGRYRLIKVLDKQAIVSFLDGSGRRTLHTGG